MSRVAVVTGGNKGIGLAVVKALCQQFDGVVYLTSRDEERGKKAVETLEAEGLKPLFHVLDIDNQATIDKFAKFLKDKHGAIHVLVNNAGVAYKGSSTAPFAEQAKVTVGTNYFGTLRACRALFPLLADTARVVNVSSSCGHLPKINGTEPHAGQLRARFAAPDLAEDELSSMMSSFVELAAAGAHREKGWTGSAYNASKVGVSALSRVQQRAFDSEGKGKVVNHVHPGYVDTDMTSHRGPLSVEEGARPIVKVALLPADTEVKGEYIWRDGSVIDWVEAPLPAPY